jgi:spore maturation protein CgeB
MRILVVGRQYPDSFARNIAVALEHMGFQVSTGFPELLKGQPKRQLLHFLLARPELFPRLGNWLQRRFVRAVAKTKPDLVFVTCAELTPPTIKELRQVAPAVAAWYPDPTANLGREYLLASDFHCVFFKEPRAVELFRKNLDLPAYFLPECCNPLWHRPQDCTSEESSRFGCDVALAGSSYYYRLRMIEGLRGFDVKMWGDGAAPWLDHPMLRFQQHRFVAEHEKAKAFRAARIVLNTFTHKDTDSVNARLFEATGCGGFVLTEGRPAVGEFFEPGREVATFDSRADLVEKVRYYLAHPEEREAIAEAGCRRAHRDHTYEIRLHQFLRIVSQRTGVCFPVSAEPAGCPGVPADASLPPAVV